MRLKTKIKTISAATFLLTILVSISASNSSAAVLWTENFNNGTINNWTVQRGSFTTSDSTLRVTSGEICENSTCPIAFVHRNSTVTIGTWAFDVYAVPSERCIVSFVRDCCKLQLGDNNVAGYSIVFDDYGIKLARHCYKSTNMLASYVDIQDTARWIHVIVTCDTDNSLKIFEDGTLRLHSKACNIGESRYFSWAVEVDPDIDEHSAIDNIIVSDSIPTSDKDPASSETVAGEAEADSFMDVEPTTVRFEVMLLCVALPPIIMATAGWRKAKDQLA